MRRVVWMVQAQKKCLALVREAGCGFRHDQLVPITS